MKALTWKYDELKENLSDHRSVTRSQSKSKTVTKGLSLIVAINELFIKYEDSDMKDSANISKASPNFTIRYPDHWLDYPGGLVHRDFVYFVVLSSIVLLSKPSLSYHI